MRFGSPRKFHKYLSRNWDPQVQDWKYTYPEEVTMPASLGGTNASPRANAFSWAGRQNFQAEQEDKMASDLNDHHSQVRTVVADRAQAEGVAKGHDGVYVALWFPADRAAELAQPGGLDADELHVTVARIGEADQLTKERDKIAALVREVAAENKPLTIGISGVSRFTGDHDGDGRDPVYAQVTQAAGLTQFHDAIVERLTQAGFSPDETHPFKPHVTLCYADVGRQSNIENVPSMSVRFDEVTLTFGDERMTFPFKRIGKSWVLA